MEDGGGEDDDMTDDQAMKEAEKMMHGLFGSMAKEGGEDDFMKEMLKNMRKWINYKLIKGYFPSLNLCRGT